MQADGYIKQILYALLLFRKPNRQIFTLHRFEVARVIRKHAITVVTLEIGPPVIEKFATDLHEFSGLPVTLHPETLSSQEAISKLIAVGASRAKKKNDHAYAACLILEDYLEFKK